MCSPTDARRVPLSGKKGQGLYALVDAEDYDRVMEHRWYPDRKPQTTYARAWPPRGGGGSRTMSLHRFILGGSCHNYEVDHENFDGLDCRKDNLRSATRGEQARHRRLFKNNRSGVKGVVWHRGKWMVRIARDGHTIHLGRFNELSQAVRAYDEAASLLHGNFALTNAELRAAATRRAS